VVKLVVCGGAPERRTAGDSSPAPGQRVPEHARDQSAHPKNRRVFGQPMHPGPGVQPL